MAIGSNQVLIASSRCLNQINFSKEKICFEPADTTEMPDGFSVCMAESCISPAMVWTDTLCKVNAIVCGIKELFSDKCPLKGSGHPRLLSLSYSFFPSPCLSVDLFFCLSHVLTSSNLLFSTPSPSKLSALDLLHGVISASNLSRPVKGTFSAALSLQWTFSACLATVWVIPTTHTCFCEMKPLFHTMIGCILPLIAWRGKRKTKS